MYQTHRCATDFENLLHNTTVVWRAFAVNRRPQQSRRPLLSTPWPSSIVLILFIRYRITTMLFPSACPPPSPLRSRDYRAFFVRVYWSYYYFTGWIMRTNWNRNDTVRTLSRRPAVCVEWEKRNETQVHLTFFLDTGGKNPIRLLFVAKSNQKSCSRVAGGTVRAQRGARVFTNRFVNEQFVVHAHITIIYAWYITFVVAPREHVSAWRDKG